jgi:hypothetical protein
MQTLFIQESDSLEDVFEANPALDGNFPKELAFLFNKKNNNWVGYALFKHNSQHFKAFVLPKIIDASQSRDIKIRQFVSYLAQVHSLDEANYRWAKNLPIEIASIKSDGESSLQKEEMLIDQFRQIKYEKLLKEIEIFFRAHRATTSQKLDYASQSIRHTLNLRKNVLSLDKSRIHQTKSQEVVYSDLAKVAYAAVRLFIQHKESLLNKHIALRQRASSLCAFLAQKFNVPRGHSLHLQALTATSVSKLFTKTPAHHNVYLNILTLFGLERFWDDERAEVRVDMQGEYFFVRPEKVYELLVQSYFESIEGVLSVKNAKKSSLTYETTIRNSDTTFTNNSDPDLVVEFSNNGKTIVDAKWKILDLTKDSPFDSSDLLKLERDLRVRAKKDDQSFNLLLVYPLVRGVNSNEFLEFRVNYNEHDIVNFKIHEIGFVLGKLLI